MEFVGLFLNKSLQKPLYQQLYDYLSDQISSGQLTAGEKLPGKRTAASQLGVSVNTVDQAYQMLAAEGYVHSRQRSGFLVARLEQQVPPPDRKALAGVLPATEPLKTSQKWRYSLSTGDIDTSFFPRKMWNRLFREVLSEEPDLFHLGEPQGDAVLRKAIASYLQGYRGVGCSPEQIVVGAGLEVLNGMLARLFPGESIAVENPGYLKTAIVLHHSGANLLPIEVDSDGMRPDLLKQSKAKIAYLTPSHQFPTGGVMPVGRRTELLIWAGENQGLLVEDDYDSEFRFDGRPLPSMQGLDEHGCVVYAGTFSRSLAPGLRAAYFVLPEWLLTRWKQLYNSYTCTVWRPEQHTLARFMQDGHFSRSLNRNRLAYRQRREHLMDALRQHLAAGSYQIHNAHTGLYMLLRLPGQNAVLLAEQARRQGILVRALAELYIKNDAANGIVSCRSSQPSVQDILVIGYGGLSDNQASEAIQALAGLINQ